MTERTGSINVTENGRHRVRITLPTKERKTLGTYDTPEEAATQLAAALEIMNSEGPHDGWTVRAWGDRWLTARELGRSIRDPQSDWGRFKTHIKEDQLGKMFLKSLRRRHTRDWLKRVRGKVARQTALNTLNVLRGMLAAAVEDEIIKTNPAAGLKLPKERRTVEPWTYGDPDEQTSIVEAAYEEVGPEAHMIDFMIGSGLRAGEVATLRLVDVCVSGPNPHVVVRYGKAPNLPTKTGKIREVPLFGRSLQAARAWLGIVARWAKANPHGLMFPRLRGGFRDERHLLRWSEWKAILKTAGITRRFRIHDLRHTAAASLVSGWWDRAWTLIEVRDFLGHESITTTERYAHLAGTALQRAAAETRARTFADRGLVVDSPKTATISSGVPGKTRTCDPRFRNSSLSVAIPNTYETKVRLASAAVAFLKAVAAGDDHAADAWRSQMGAALVADTTVAIELAEAVAIEIAPETQAVGT